MRYLLRHPARAALAGAIAIAFSAILYRTADVSSFLALSSQVLGWLLITVSLPRLPIVATSLLLTLQPAAAVVFAAILLGEDPSPLQLTGAAAILAGLIVASGGRRAGAPAAVPEQA
jgi:drug/metabolite transporter (DMT)-like permease